MERIRVSEGEIDALLDERRVAAGMVPQLNIAQILVTVPEGASAAEVAERHARAEAARARVRAGEPFEAVAKEVSEDGNRAEGGMIGLRPADRLPDVFVNAVRGLRSGDVRAGTAPHRCRLSPAEGDRAPRRRQLYGPTDARSSHPAAHLGPAASRPGDPPPGRHQAEDRRRHPIVRGGSTRELRGLERDAQAAIWAGSSPGTFVPEFEEVINRLQPGGHVRSGRLAVRRAPDPGTRRAAR